jgi:hypothetical protein
MPEHEQEEHTYYERTDTLEQFDDFVSEAIYSNMYPTGRTDENEEC